MSDSLLPCLHFGSLIVTLFSFVKFVSVIKVGSEKQNVLRIETLRKPLL